MLYYRDINMEIEVRTDTKSVLCAVIANDIYEVSHV